MSTQPSPEQPVSAVSRTTVFRLKGRYERLYICLTCGSSVPYDLQMKHAEWHIDASDARPKGSS